MNWQDYLAFTLFAAATVLVAFRTYRALFVPAKPGCGSGCGSCSSKAAPSQATNLLTIGEAPQDGSSDPLRHTFGG
jgi:hypothetical protein